MTETLYPLYYGTRLVTLDVIMATLEPNMHPEAFRRGINFIRWQGGKVGVGGGYRAPGTQPNKPGAAPEGKSFHQPQKFPSGIFYTAWDTVVVNPGYVHRAPRWSEVPKQGTQLALDLGYHMNVSTETWHGQPIELDGYDTWVRAGRPDLEYDRDILIFDPRPQPEQPEVPSDPINTEEITVEFTSRYLQEGTVGADVKFFQRFLNDIAGQGLLLDGHYGPKTTRAVTNWQNFFKVRGDDPGDLGPATQRSIIEVSLLVS